jgi:hypothetical protein
MTDTDLDEIPDAETDPEGYQRWLEAYRQQSRFNSLRQAYHDYGDIIDVLHAEYDISWEEAADQTDGYIEDEAEVAAEERRSELVNNAEETAATIASDNGWTAKEEDEEEDEDGPSFFRNRPSWTY